MWGDAKPATIAALNEAGEATSALLGGLRSALIERLLPRLTTFTLEGVAERKREGRLEFHDLLVHARDLLRSNAAVRTALSERIDVILIDEFQDTDPLQLDIAFALASTDPSAEPPPWDQASLQPGKVLLVGDPKQSIYRFRGADISLWDRTKRLFPDGVERLGQNFRTVPPLLEWVNRVFGAVIAEGAEGVQPPYEALAPFRPDVREAPAVVVVGTCVPDGRAIELREQEAEDLARLIVAMKLESWPVSDDSADEGWRPTRFDDVAVLVPTRTPLRQLERALDRHDVPYRIESRSLVWATEAVRELLSILTAIDDPGDAVAIVAALRSPGFACSDVDLLEWKLAGGRWDHQGAPPETIAADHPVAAGMAALARYHAERGDCPVNALVERVIRERKLVELTFVQRRPRDHWRRLRFVVDQARAFVEAGGASLGDFVSWAQLQTDENATVIETPAPEPDDDAVRILTIHGSKGLEFPIVVLAGLSSKPNMSGPSVQFGVDRPEVAVGPKGRRFATPGFAALADAASDADEHEAKRLLYVAATRARDHLAISLHHSAKGPSRSSAAAALWQASHEAAAGWWREAAIADQLALPVDVAASARSCRCPTTSAMLASMSAKRCSPPPTAGASGPPPRSRARPTTSNRSSAPSSRADEPGFAADAVAAGRHRARARGPCRPSVGRFRRAPRHRAAGRGVRGGRGACRRRRRGRSRTPCGGRARVARDPRSEVSRREPTMARVVRRRAGGIGRSGRFRGGGRRGLHRLVVRGRPRRARGRRLQDRSRHHARRGSGGGEALPPAGRAYALAVGEVLRRPVARAVLVFCGRDGAVEHEIDDLPAAVEHARGIATRFTRECLFKGAPIRRRRGLGHRVFEALRIAVQRAPGDDTLAPDAHARPDRVHVEPAVDFDIDAVAPVSARARTSMIFGSMVAR